MILAFMVVESFLKHKEMIKFYKSSDLNFFSQVSQMKRIMSISKKKLVLVYTLKIGQFNSQKFWQLFETEEKKDHQCISKH